MSRNNDRSHGPKKEKVYHDRWDWYPKTNGNYYGRAFLKTLAEDNPDLYNQVRPWFSTKRSSLVTSNNLPANLSSLEQMASLCRQKEINLLRTIPGIQIDEHDNRKIGQYIKAFNDLLGSSAIFENNIKRIQDIRKQINSSTGEETFTGGGKIDISTKFPQFLLEEITEKGKAIINLSESSLKNAVMDALIKMFSWVPAEQKRKGITSPYLELAQTLEKFRDSGENEAHWLVQEIYDLYFKPQFGEELKQADSKRKKDLLSKQTTEKLIKSINYQNWFGNKKGGVLEAEEAFIVEVLQKALKTYRTGATGMKADNIIATGEISLDFSKMFNDIQSIDNPSKRLSNIDLLEQFHKSAKGLKGSIIEVTDKNYSLSSKSFAENKGFTGESAIRSDFFEEIMHKMGVDSDRIADLMFVLANTNDELISGDHDFKNAERFLAAYIGFFLFDDLKIDDTFGDDTVNYVHVMNLDGIYIPFSTFLDAAVKAFKETSKEDNFRKYANVIITDDFEKWERPNHPINEKDWQDFYDERLRDVRITTHFFGDFVNFIKENIKL